MIRGDGGEGFGDRPLQVLHDSRLDPTQLLFQLGPGLLDGVEVGRIVRQIQLLCAAAFDQRTHARDFVGPQVVEDHDVAGFELGRQHLFEEGKEHIAIGRRFNGHAGQHTLRGQCRQHRQQPPVTGRNRFPDAFRARRPAIAAGHFCGHAAFVEKHQTGGTDLADQFPPRVPPPEVRGRFLFFRAERFF